MKFVLMKESNFVRGSRPTPLIHVLKTNSDVGIVFPEWFFL